MNSFFRTPLGFSLTVLLPTFHSNSRDNPRVSGEFVRSHNCDLTCSAGQSMSSQSQLSVQDPRHELLRNSLDEWMNDVKDSERYEIHQQVNEGSDFRKQRVTQITDRWRNKVTSGGRALRKSPTGERRNDADHSANHLRVIGEDISLQLCTGWQKLSTSG